jgi:hypothetical protein
MVSLAGIPSLYGVDVVSCGETVTAFRIESVADAANRQQVTRRASAILEIPPQPDDEVVDGARIGVLVQSPDVLEDLARVTRPGQRCE